MKTIVSTIIIILAISLGCMAQKKNFFDFKTTSLDGKPYDLAQLKGKKVLVVNTASKCGHTPQYKDLEDLYKQYGGDKFVIIGFPSNDFLKQEPGTNAEISEFCTKNYGVTFPMMSKISVKGKKMDPIYKWLTSKKENGVMDAKVTWNFQKFMIDENGNLVGMVPPGDNPKCDKIINWINQK
jgi:glutathione peroxidase